MIENSVYSFEFLLIFNKFSIYFQIMADDLIKIEIIVVEKVDISLSHD